MHEMWEPIPRNDSFVLKNCGTGELLCHNTSDRWDLISTVRSTDIADLACHWKLEDTTGESPVDYTIIYDSTLSFLPPSLLGAPSIPDDAHVDASNPDHHNCR